MANQRFAKARAIAVNNLVEVKETDESGRVVTAICPGSEGRQYFVTIYRNGEVTVQCQRVGGDLCIACQHGLVCYHALAVLMVSATRMRQLVSLTHDGSHAARLRNLGGSVMRIFSDYNRDGAGSKPTWIIHRPVEKQTLTAASSV